MHPVVVEARGRGDELDVGPLEARAGGHEGAGLAHVGGEGATARGLPLHESRGRHVVDGHVLGGGRPHQRRDDVVVQVATDGGCVEDDVDAVLAQVLRRTDAGQHHQLRGVDRAAAQHDLRLGPRGLDGAAREVLDTHGPGAVHQHPGRQGTGTDREVRPAADLGAEVGLGGRPATAAVAGDLVATRTHLRLAVEVVVGREPALPRRLQPGQGALVGVATVLDVQRPVGAVEGVGTAGVALAPHEVGQHVGVGPADGTEVALPAVEVGAGAADVHHRVHRRAAAERLHPRPVGALAAETRLRGRGVVPVPPGLEQVGEGRGHRDLERVGLGSCLEQQDRGARVLAQARGDDGAGAAGPDHDVVVRAVLGHGDLR